MSKSVQKTATKSAASTTGKLTAKEMVLDAISSLNERNGSSMPAIKKFIAGKYPNVDMQHYMVSIKKFLKLSIDNGTISKPTGQGLSGKLSFLNWHFRYTWNNLKIFRQPSGS